MHTLYTSQEFSSNSIFCGQSLSIKMNFGKVVTAGKANILQGLRGIVEENWGNGGVFRGR